MKKITYLLTLVLFALLSTAQAQNPTDKIDLKKFNDRYLAELINAKINTLRDSLKLHKLEKDSLLEMAAKNHSAYIKKTDDISHLQPTPEFSNLEKRVEYFKGTQEKLSEIIEVIYLDKPTQIYKEKETIKIYTYGEAADFYFKNSYNTSAHYDIITKRDMYTSGISFGVNEERKCIYVVQVFGSKAFKFHHSVKHKDNKKTFYPSKKLNVENAYGLQPYDEKICRKCIEKFNLVPDYVKYGLTVENKKIYFNFSDLAVFEKVFMDGDEAIAVDILHIDQYPCNAGNMLHRSVIHDGILSKPLNKSDILKNNTKDKESNAIKVFMGDCPYTNPNEFELSLLLIKTNTLCDYRMSVPTPTFRTEIMEIDLYTDTLSKSEILKKKNLRFGIPFEKSKAEYQEKDIKPFYDSLNLNKFNIKEMTILAYSSVEGSAEKNLELQKQRAQSIVNVLQSFQLDSIKTVIRTLENWDQFFRDVKNSSYAWLSTLDKPTIKEKLQQDTLALALEPILKKERKAFITLKVVEKIDLTGDKHELVKHYMNALAKKDVANASILQSTLFDAISSDEMKYDMVGLVAIPKTKEFAQMINNDVVFRYTNKIPGDYIKNLEDASALDPSNLFIKFNIYNIQLKSWADSSMLVSNPDPIIKNIKTLFNTKVDKKMVNQIYLNYYILVTDMYKKNQKYKYRDDAVGLVKKYYKTVEATQKDYLILSNYFVSHGRKDYALEVLQPLIESGEYTEDILFAYLSLTVPDFNSYEKNSTISLMKKAKELNKDKFCKLFGTDKLKFQLFKSEELKDMYCETCKAAQ
jgi:uncharacterized protein YkwD